MSTIPTIQLLVKSITTLSNSLPPSVPKGTTRDKIWTVMHLPEGETVYETFNRRFDALFAEDCRSDDGRLYHIRQGKSGMGLVGSYLKKIDWSGLPLDLVEIKLQRLVTELKYLTYVLFLFVASGILRNMQYCLHRRAKTNTSTKSNNQTHRYQQHREGRIGISTSSCCRFSPEPYHGPKSAPRSTVYRSRNFDSTNSISWFLRKVPNTNNISCAFHQPHAET